MSTTSAALHSAISGLNASGQALSTVSNNLANSSTVGYKANSTRFVDLITSDSSSGTASVSAGASAKTRQNVTWQGNISSANSKLDTAISGNGFFCVTPTANGSGAVATTEYFYTRDGQFSLDQDGYLTLGGDYYLEGYGATYSPTTGTSTIGSTLSALRVDTTSSAWKSTSTVSVDANLPEDLMADALSGSVTSVSTAFVISDASGASETVTLTFTPDSSTVDQWTVSLSSGDAAASFSPSSYTVSFNPSTGAVSSVNGASGTSVSIAVTNANGSQAVAFDFADLTQHDRGSDLSVTSIDQNGYLKSSYSGLSIADDGTVSETYGSGLSVTVGKIALANFANANGLTVLSDNLYQQSATSGTAAIGLVGDNGTGSLENEALEASTTDTGTSFTKMILAQQSYSAASQVLSTCNDMYGTLADLKS